jgi:hypothetical protein
LEGLHAREEIEELRGERIGVEAGVGEGEEQLVRGFERGEAAFLRLLLDDEAARRGGREHHARQFLKRGAEAEHFARAAPRAVEEEDDEPAAVELGGGEGAGGEIARGGAGINEDREIGGIVNQRLDGGVLVEADAHVDFAVGEAEVREAAGAGFFVFPFLGMHEEDELRPRGHRGDGRTPAQRLWPETAVAGEATHGIAGSVVGRKSGSTRGRRQNVAIWRAGVHDCAQCLPTKRINR